MPVPMSASTRHECNESNGSAISTENGIDIDVVPLKAMAVAAFPWIDALPARPTQVAVSSDILWK